MKNIPSELIAINDIIQSSNIYNIPRYQRLYVWEEEQVKTLLDDMWSAYQASKKLFYLGGILVIKQTENSKVYDLIDGQQRFTTALFKMFRRAS